MKMLVQSGMLAALLGLAGCQPDGAGMETKNPGAPEMASDECGAAALQSYVGQPVTAYDFKAAHETVRILPPGGAMTLDFRPDRLNVELDKDNKIKRIFCG